MSLEQCNNHGCPLGQHCERIQGRLQQEWRPMRRFEYQVQDGQITCADYVPAKEVTLREVDMRRVV